MWPSVFEVSGAQTQMEKVVRAVESENSKNVCVCRRLWRTCRVWVWIGSIGLRVLYEAGMFPEHDVHDDMRGFKLHAAEQNRNKLSIGSYTYELHFFHGAQRSTELYSKLAAGR